VSMTLYMAEKIPECNYDGVQQNYAVTKMGAFKTRSRIGPSDLLVSCSWTKTIWVKPPPQAMSGLRVTGSFKSITHATTRVYLTCSKRTDEQQAFSTAQ